MTAGRLSHASPVDEAATQDGLHGPALVRSDDVPVATPAERRHVFPPPMDRHYPTVDGRITTRSLEAHIVDHCNLTCAQCCSLSPLLPPGFTDPAGLARDLHLAKRVLRPGMFKLVGGEPLLHPQLLEIVHAVRESGIASTLSITTNGTRLADMPDAVWLAIDALTISRYPRPGLSAALVAHIQAQAARFAVRLNWKHQDTFTQMDRASPLEAGETARALFRDCWIRERCHLIRDGRFYTCTRPAHFHTLYQGTRDFQADGVRLHDGPTLLHELADYLARETPLQACLHCHGGSAPVAPHRLMRRGEVAQLKAAYP